MKRWMLALAAAFVLTAGPPLERARPEAGPVSMSAGAAALDEAFTQEFAEERRPDHITFRYSRETWELDWEDWWDYRQGELDLEGIIGKIRIRVEGAAAASPPVPVRDTKIEAKREGLPWPWILAGIGFVVVLISVGVIWILTRNKAAQPPRAAGPAWGGPQPPPLPPPLPVPLPTHLCFQTGPMAGQTLLLGQGLRLGREHDCHVVVEDVSVSRHHADLVPGPHGWVLRDLGSSNGTFVNGVRIQGEVLLRGDETLGFGTVQAHLTAG